MNGIGTELIQDPNFWIPYIDNGETTQIGCVAPEEAAPAYNPEHSYDPTEPAYIPTPKNIGEKASDCPGRKGKGKGKGKEDKTTKTNKEPDINANHKAINVAGNVQEEASLETSCCLYEELRPKYNQLLHHYQHVRKRYDDLRESMKKGNEKKRKMNERMFEDADTDDEMLSLKSGIKKPFVKKGKKKTN